MKLIVIYFFLLHSFSAFSQGQSFSTAFWKKRTPPSTPPSNLYITHVANNRIFDYGWTAGVGNGGNCKLQFLNGTIWTDISGGFPDACDSTVSAQKGLSTTTGWTSHFLSGLTVRLVRVNDGAVLGTFPQQLTCSPMNGSATSTPNVDEDCNGNWNNTTTGTLMSCPAGESCRKATVYNGSNTCGGAPSTVTTECRSTSIPDGCLPVSSRSVFLEPGTGCTTANQTLYY